MATKNIGFVVELIGDAEVRSVDGIIRVLSIGDQIHEGDILTTGLNTEIVLEFYDGHKLQVGENTEMLLDESVFAGLNAYPDDRADQLAELQNLIVEGVDLAELEATAAGAAADSGDALHQASVYSRDGAEGIVETRGTPFDVNAGSDDQSVIADNDVLAIPEDDAVTPTSPIAAITVDNITADDIINAAETGGMINVTGSVGGAAAMGDSVNLYVNSTTYTGTVTATNSFNVMVAAPDLVADTSFNATVSGTDTDGNSYSATTISTHTVDTTATATITLDANITADDSIDAAEALGPVAITGTVAGDFQAGDIVTLTVNGINSIGGVLADGSFSINVSGSDLRNDPDSTIDASFVASDAAGNVAAPVTDTETYLVNNAPDAMDDAGALDIAEDGTTVSLNATMLANDTDLDGDAISITAINGTALIGGVQSIAVTNGTVNIDAGDNITFTPDANYNGPVSFDYTLSDGNLTDTATVSGTVTDVNDAPVAVVDSASVAEDGSVDVNVLLNDTDLDGTIDPTTVVITTGPSNGTVSVNATTGVVTYTPNANYFGPDSFSYTVEDDDGQVSNIAAVSLTVTDVNDAPVAVVDSASVAEDGSVDVDVVANDTDLDGTIDPTTVLITTGPTNGTVSVNATTGVVTYTPNANYFGPDSFSYTVEDDDGQVSNVAAVSLTVTDVNDAPVAVVDSASVAEDGSVDVDVVANDTDLDGTIDPTTVVITTGPTNGTVSVNATTGVVTYTPNTNYFGPDSFSYTVEDDDGQVSNIAAVNLTVTDVNDAPVAVVDSASVAEDGSVDVDVVANDTDLDGTIDPTTVVITTGPSNGTVSVNATTGVVTYTPNANYFGPDSFSYTVEDDDGQVSNVAAVSLTVTDVNDAPVAVVDSASVAEDGSVDVNVLLNDTDLDGTIDPTTVVITTGPTNGTVSVNATTGVVTYTPNANYFGPDSFSYTVEDDDGQVSNIAAVSLTVTDVNDAPVAVVDSASVAEDGSVDVDVVANDTDLDGTIDPTTVVITTGPTNGTVSINATTGVVTYTPNANYFGPDSFSYTVEDDDGQVSNIAAVSLTVTDVNDAPVAVVDAATVAEDGSVDVDVVANDTDLDGTIDPTTVVITTGPTNGTVSVNATTGVVTYTPNANYFGPDSFSYTVEDDDGQVSNVAAVSLTVTDVNDAPVAVVDSASVAEDGSVDVDVVANDTDLDGTIDPTTVVITTGPTNGTVSVNATTGVVTYTPNANYFGPDSFSYTVEDDDGQVSNVAAVSLTVTDVNDAPVAVVDSASVAEDGSVDVDVVANDTDLDGTIDPTTVVITTGPTNGTVSVNAVTGVVTYTPNANYFGPDSFSYTVEDDDGQVSNIAAVSLTVTDVNDAPVAVVDSASVAEDGSVDVDVVANDTDLDGTI
ncbi:MAG: retention module-containing protein, partial [Gammaproteobacteria bacterium]|nr:retention module-containing protein [Gammaproteobacteria bacterium]